MTLYDYILQSKNWENPVYDESYDIEFYFYKPKPGETLDDWDKGMLTLAKALTVTESNEHGATVNLSEVIEKKLPELDEAGLFLLCDIDTIMDDMMSILSGNVSEKWMMKFAEVLSGENLVKEVPETEKKAFRIAITETYTKEVEIYAEEVWEAQEIAENLCNDGVINIDYTDFVDRNTECRGEAILMDLELHEVYNAKGPIKNKKPELDDVIQSAEDKKVSEPAEKNNPELEPEL